MRCELARIVWVLRYIRFTSSQFSADIVLRYSISVSVRVCITPLFSIIAVRIYLGNLYTLRENNGNNIRYRL